MKSPNKESKLSKFVNEKLKPIAGDVLEVIGDITGRESISKVGEFLNGRKADNAEMQALWLEFEAKKMEFELEFNRLELESFKTEVQDRENSRNMRNEFTKQGKIDWLLTGFVSLMVFLFIFQSWFHLYYVVPEANLQTVKEILSINKEILFMIAFYLVGSTAGSRRKTESMERMVNK